MLTRLNMISGIKNIQSKVILKEKLFSVSHIMRDLVEFCDVLCGVLNLVFVPLL